MGGTLDNNDNYDVDDKDVSLVAMLKKTTTRRKKGGDTETMYGTRDEYTNKDKDKNSGRDDNGWNNVLTAVAKGVATESTTKRKNIATQKKKQKKKKSTAERNDDNDDDGDSGKPIVKEVVDKNSNNKSKSKRCNKIKSGNNNDEILCCSETLCQMISTIRLKILGIHPKHHQCNKGCGGYMHGGYICSNQENDSITIICCW